jgi:hypothetical protein
VNCVLTALAYLPGLIHSLIVTFTCVIGGAAASWSLDRTAPDPSPSLSHHCFVAPQALPLLQRDVRHDAGRRHRQRRARLRLPDDDHRGGARSVLDDDGRLLRGAGHAVRGPDDGPDDVLRGREVGGVCSHAGGAPGRSLSVKEEARGRPALSGANNAALRGD